MDNSQRRHRKIRINDSTLNPEVVPAGDLQRYIASVRDSRKDFYQRLIDAHGPPRPFVRGSGSWEIVNEIRAPLRRWIGTSSVEFTLTSSINAPYAGVVKKPRGRPRKDAPKVQLPAVPVEWQEGPFRIPIFKSQALNFNIDQFTGNPQVKSLQVAEIYRELVNEVGNEAGPSKAGKTGKAGGKRVAANVDKLTREAQVLFCGGPISALATAPRCTASGGELVLVTSFADERMMCLGSVNEAAYIQFWTFTSELGNAQLKFLLELPDVGSVMALRWCPVFNEEMLELKEKEVVPSKRVRRTRSQGKAQSTTLLSSQGDTLGYVAASTNTGKIMIYGVPRDLDAMLNGLDGVLPVDSPLILSTEPLLVLEHPDVVVNMPNDPQEEGAREMQKRRVKQEEMLIKQEQRDAGQEEEGEKDESMEKEEENAEDHGRMTPIAVDSAPFVALDWSPFAGSKHIAAISLTGHIFVWNIEDPTHPSILHSTDWNAQPISVYWFKDNIVCVSFANKLIKLLDVDTGDCVFDENSPRVAGRKTATCPSVFPGFFTCDTHMLNTKAVTKAESGILYTCSCYIVPIEENTEERSEDQEEENGPEALMIPIFNNHQVQAFHTCVCAMTGVVGSVGADGRLVHTICGHIEPHSPADGKTLGFVATRTVLQLLSKRKELRSNEAEAEADENKNKLCYSHAECCENRQLELYLGDAADRDRFHKKKWGTKMPEACADRRLESLTHLEFSKITPALSVVGGESGLVFIIPSVL